MTTKPLHLDMHEQIECAPTLASRFYAASQNNCERVNRAAAISDEVQREDIELCEHVQKGLRSSTYDRGRYSVKRENGVHHFHMLLSEFLARP
jgi:choline monooxygenase